MSGKRRNLFHSPIRTSNQRSTTDLPLAPEFRDALTRHLLSCSPFRPIKPAPHVERRLNSRTNSHLSSFIPASRAACPSSKCSCRQHPVPSGRRAKRKEIHAHAHITCHPVLCTNAYSLAVLESQQAGRCAASPRDATLGAHRSRPGWGSLCLHRGSTDNLYTGALHCEPHALKTFLILKTSFPSLSPQLPASSCWR